MELNIPAIEGIGGSLIYLVDRYGDRTIYDVDFTPLIGAARRPPGSGSTAIDHLTHNVHRGRMSCGPSFTSGSSIFVRSAISTSRAS